MRVGDRIVVHRRLPQDLCECAAPDGRVAGWADEATDEGTHRLVFGSGDYFAGQGVETFYPEVVVVFAVTDPDRHHHVPLLLSPFAYSTYRGS